jgi:hypothetical protein
LPAVATQRPQVFIVNKTATDTLSKVPAVTLGFSVIKIAATTLGETGGDAVTMTLNLGYLIGTLIFCVILVAAVSTQVFAKLVFAAGMRATSPDNVSSNAATRFNPRAAAYELSNVVETAETAQTRGREEWRRQRALQSGGLFARWCALVRLQSQWLRIPPDAHSAAPRWVRARGGVPTTPQLFHLRAFVVAVAAQPRLQSRR